MSGVEPDAVSDDLGILENTAGVAAGSNVDTKSDGDEGESGDGAGTATPSEPKVKSEAKRLGDSHLYTVLQQEGHRRHDSPHSRETT